MQTNKQSLVEVTTGVVLGLAISTTINLFLLPIWGFKPTIIESIEMTSVFTAVGFVRGYVTRRFFNWLNNRGDKK